MASEDVRVLGRWASPFTIRVKIAFNLRSVEYEFIEEDPKNWSGLLLKSNPVYKRVPVLIHHGKPVCESSIIVQYIDESWATSGPSILPSDPYDRAIARFWAVFIDDELFPSALLAILKAKTKEEEAAAAEKVFDKLTLMEEAFEKCSKGKRFFGGDTIGYLDITFGSLLGWMEATKELSGVEVLDSTRTPRLVSWAESFRSEEEVKKALPGTDKFVEFIKKFQPIWKGLATAN